MNLSKKTIYVYLLVLETAALFWFSLTPPIVMIKTGLFRTGDIEHFIAYSVYGFLWLKSLYIWKGKKFEGKKRLILFSVLMGSAIGGLLEVMQYFVPYRTADMLDWAVDAIGSLAGALPASKFKDGSQN